MHLLRKLLSCYRLLAIFLLSLFWCARGVCQLVSLSVNRMPLQKVFSLIEKQTEYNFIYSSETLSGSKEVTLEVKNEKLPRVLELCFRNQPLTYIVDRKSIVVKNIAIPDPPDSVFIDVKGRVVDENGDGVTATITELATSNAIGSDAQGFFLLKHVLPNAVLSVTGVNILTIQVRLNGKENLGVLEVRTRITEGTNVKIVSTGFQQLNKERATGSFATVDQEQFDIRTSPDVISRLEGITSGLVFNKQGLTGQTELTIRGRSTIFANDQPLIVVDNFPYDGDISSLNPNDVESITLLKDAAAASIWGVRASNGVIVITTKKGRFNHPLRVQLSSNVTVGAKSNLFYNPNFLNSSDFIDIEKYLFNQGYYASDEISLQQVPISPVVELLIKARDGLISQAEADQQINRLRNVDVRNDLEKYLYRRSIEQQDAMTLSGGSEGYAYYFSAGFDNNRPSQVLDNYRRVTLVSNNSIALTKNLKVEIGLNYAQSNLQNNLGGTNNNTGGPQAKKIYPYAELADADGNPLPIVRDYRSPYVAGAEAAGFLNWQYFPLQDLGLRTDNTRLSDMRMNSSISYTISPGVSVNVRYQYQKLITDDRNLADEQSYFVRNTINQFASTSGGVVTKIDNVPLGGIYNLTNTTQVSQNIRADINYNHAWGRQQVDAIAGVEVRQLQGDSYNNILYGYDHTLGSSQFVADPVDFLPLTPSGNYATIPAGSGISGTLDRFRSYFANAAYTFNEKYTFSASGRIDQSNLFGVKANQRSVPLWSSGFRWKLSREHFYHVAWLPKLSLRATYGYNGNLDRSVTAITTFQYQPAGAYYTGATYATINNIGNPQLRWERTGIFNLGIDFATRNDVVNGSLEFFQKRGLDLIGDAQLPPASGITQLRGNFANMSGHGIDLQLNSKNINKGFQWRTSFLLSYATDKVTKYNIPFTPSLYIGADGNFDKIPIEGYPLYSVFAYKWAGLDHFTGDPIGYNSDTLSKDYSLLNSPNKQDLVYFGAARPTISGGLTNTFSYRGFALSVNISYKLGYYFRRSSAFYDQLFSSWVGNKDISKRWQKPGDELTTNVPSLVYPSDLERDLFYNNSEVLVEKGDHVRLQYISLGYELHSSFLSKLSIQSMRLEAIVNNLGIIWKANKAGLDPDFASPSNAVSDAVSIPNPRTFGFGIKLLF